MGFRADRAETKAWMMTFDTYRLPNSSLTIPESRPFIPAEKNELKFTRINAESLIEEEYLLLMSFMHMNCIHWAESVASYTSIVHENTC